MIEVKNLFKRFEGGEALCGVDFSVKTGEICAVVGLEGSGKTTLTDLVTGCIEPDQGQALICGIDVAKRNSEAKQHLGYVPSEGGLYQDMTPRAGMKFIADALGMSSREAGEKIDAAVRRFGIKDVADTTVSSLSAGACKLVALAQAAFAGAEAMIIDEPTQGLNAKEILEMREAIKDLREDHAVLLTSKNITEVCQVADYVLILHNGRVLTEGTPDQLHLLTVKDGTLRLVVRCGEDAAKKAFEGIGKGMEITAAAEEGAVEVILGSNGADLRPAAFKAVCSAGVELLHFGLFEKPLDELLMKMDSERIVYSPEKEDSVDEGNL